MRVSGESKLNTLWLTPPATNFAIVDPDPLPDWDDLGA